MRRRPAPTSSACNILRTPETASRITALKAGEAIRFDPFPVGDARGALAWQAVLEMRTEIGVAAELDVAEPWTGNDAAMMTRSWPNLMSLAGPFGGFGAMRAPGGPSESVGRFHTDAACAAARERFRFSPDVADQRKAYAEPMDRIKAAPRSCRSTAPMRAGG